MATPDKPAGPWFEVLPDGTEALHVELDLDNLTLGDLEEMEAYEDNGENRKVRDLLGVLNKIVVGGVRGIPVKKLKVLLEAIKAEIGKVSNPFEQPTGV